MNQPDYAYLTGYLIGGPLVAFLIGFVLVKLIKKRNPNKKEIIIIAVVAVVLGILSVASKFSKTSAY